MRVVQLEILHLVVYVGCENENPKFAIATFQLYSKHIIVVPSHNPLLTGQWK